MKRKWIYFFISIVIINISLLNLTTQSENNVSTTYVNENNNSEIISIVVDKDTCHWVLSSIPQVLAALLGFIIAAYAFFFNRDKDNLEDDLIRKLNDESQIRVIRLAILCILTISVSLFFLFFIDVLYNFNHFIIYLIPLFLTFLSLFEALRFIVDFINPTSLSTKADEIIKMREQGYKSRTFIKAAEIFPYFLKLEYLLDHLVRINNIDKEYKLDEKVNKRRILSILSKLKIINKNEFEILNNSLNLRNLVVHAKVQELNEEELKLVKNSIKIILNKLNLPAFEIYKDAAGSYRARYRDKNGDIILFTEGFMTKDACINTINSIKKNALDAGVSEID